MTKDDYRRKLRGNVMTVDEYNGIVLGVEDNVVRSGYRSAQDQIYELLRAGQRLQTAREERYAVPTGLTPRHYGEIDITIAKDKLRNLRDQTVQKAREKKEAAEAEAIAKEEAKKAQEQKAQEAKPGDPKPAAPESGVT